MSFLKCKQYAQRYRKAWEEETVFQGWLTEYQGDSTHGFCKICKVKIVARKKDLTDHSKTQKHENNSKADKLPKMQTFLKTAPISTGIKFKELKLAAFIAEHTSMKCVDHLGELLKNLEADKFDIKLHRTKCTRIITEILAPELKREMLEDIGDSSFSLIIDESNYCSNIKCLGVTIRYWSAKKQKIVDTMYCLVPLDNCDANGIFKTLIETITIDDLKIERLCGVGVDGANVMVGGNHSVYTLVKSQSGDHLLLNRCICHPLHLAASKAFEVLPKHLEFMIKETCSWFSYSHKRRSDFEELYKTVNANEKPLKLSHLSLTRWLARRAVVEKILNQWDVLFLHFGIAESTERCYTADLLYQMYSDPSNRVYLTYVHYILDDVCRTNTIFQAKDPNMLCMLEELANLYMGLLKKVVVPQQLVSVTIENLLNFDFEKFIMHTSAMYFGYNVESIMIECAISSSQCTAIKERCNYF